MTLSTLTLEYEDFQRETAVLLGWSRDPDTWNNTQLQDFEDIDRRAARLFYFPAESGEDAPTYEWTFLRTNGTITLVAGNSSYALADDFGGTILDYSTSYAASSGRRKLRKVSESEIRSAQSMSPKTDWPSYYAVAPAAHSYLTGQLWNMTVYPTPGTAQATAVITFRYVFVPNQLSAINKYPVGGAQYGEVLLAAYLAAAEQKMDDDPNGPLTQRFTTMLASAMRNDKQQKANDRGGKA